MDSEVLRLSHLHPRYWITWFGFLLLLLISWLPGSIRRGIGKLFGRLFLSGNKKRNEIINTNLEWALPHLNAQQRKALTRQISAYYGQLILDLGVLWWAPHRRLKNQFKIEGGEHIERLIKEGRNGVLITNHSYFIDFWALILTSLYPVAGYAQRARNPIFQWAMDKSRRRYGGTVLMRESSFRDVVRSVATGKYLLYAADDDYGSQNSVFAPLFGIQKATLTVPSRIARLTGAVLVPVTCYFDESLKRYRVVIMAPLEGVPGEDPVADATAINQAIETMVLMAPEQQYLWGLRFYQTRPDGSPPPYKMKGKPGSGPRPRPDTPAKPSGDGIISK